MTKPSRKWLDELTTRIEGLLPARIRRSYAAKFGAVLVGVLVLMLVVGAYVQLQSGDIVREDTRAQISGTADGEAEALQKWVTKQRSTTRFLADAAGRNMSATERQALVEREFIDLPSEAQAIHYVDTESGEILASTTDSSVGTTPRLASRCALTNVRPSTWLRSVEARAAPWSPSGFSTKATPAPQVTINSKRTGANRGMPPPPRMSGT